MLPLYSVFSFINVRPQLYFLISVRHLMMDIMGYLYIKQVYTYKYMYLYMDIWGYLKHKWI